MTALGEERGGHADVIKCAYPLQEWMVGVGGLNEDFAAVIAAASASADLHHQLEGALVGTEVGDAHQTVGVENADDAYATEVKAFRQHLCPYEQLRMALLKIREHTAVSVTGAHGIGVEPADAGGGVKGCKLLLHAFGTES